MSTLCSQSEIKFQGLFSRSVVANFSGGDITSDAGLLLLREADLGLRFISQAAGAFTDHRDPARVEHSVEELLRQRVLALAAGYEDLNDHDSLRFDPLMALVSGKADPTGASRRHQRDRKCACAGKSTLNRLELSPDLPVHQKDRYHKISWNPEVFDELFLSTFLRSYREVPAQIILDLDATDDLIHGHQEGRFFHGYYDAYCYLPLYIFAGNHLLCARLRPSDIDAPAGWEAEIERIVEAVRKRFPKTQIILRGDSGFCREEIMKWCDDSGVDYILGLAKNSRLESEIAVPLEEAKQAWKISGEPERRWKDFMWRTKKSWSRERRVVGKAEWISGGEEGRANPRFVVTSLGVDLYDTRSLYEELYCARGEMENRIKEQQADLFADRTSTGFLKSNQLRVYVSALAYVLMNEVRDRALRGTSLARATMGTIRLKLFKAGALVKVSVRRVLVNFSSGWPTQEIFKQAVRNLRTSFG